MNIEFKEFRQSRHRTLGFWLWQLCSCLKGKGFVRMSAIYSVATNMISNRKLGMWEMDRIRVSK